MGGGIGTTFFVREHGSILIMGEWNCMVPVVATGGLAPGPPRLGDVGWMRLCSGTGREFQSIQATFIVDLSKRESVSVVSFWFGRTLDILIIQV